MSDQSQSETRPAAATVPVPASPRRILLVDDEAPLLRSIQRLLRHHGWEVHTAETAERGLEMLAEVRPMVVMSDFRMPGMNGVHFLAEVKRRQPSIQRVLFTGQVDFEMLEEAINSSGVFRFLAKPIDNQQLVLTVQGAYEQYELLEQNAHLIELTQEQNRALLELNADLETRVQLRTHMLTMAKRDWERSFDSLDMPMTVVRADYRLNRVNLSAAKLGGQTLESISDSPSCHRYLFGRDTPCENCPAPAARERLGSSEGDVVNGGHTYVVSASALGGDRRAVMTYRDVTQERARTRQQVETEKMAAVGQLAGGVAHEINNPLGGILAFAQLMRREPGRDQEDMEALGLIEESAVRCKRIVESLLQFSRRSRVEDRRPFDLSVCAEDAVRLFGAQLIRREDVALVSDLARDLPPVNGDPVQLAQVVLNLLQNGLHALQDNGGRLTVRTSRQDSKCVLQVEDTGTGIAAEHLPHIFEPSFTTKPPGQGTGLGLSIAYRIVEEHGGTLEVRTSIGRGSVFLMYLPAMGATQEGQA